MLKGGLRGGLTGMTRSFGGSEVDIEPFVEIAKKQMERESKDSISDGLAARLAKTGLSLEAYLRGCNAHLVDDPEPATHLPYFDIISLYPAAGKGVLFTRDTFC
jgi:hypothetical protein